MILDIFSYIFVVAGIILTAINLPGIWIVWLGILFSAIHDGFEHITAFWLIFLFLLALISTFVDNIAALLGARKFGASKWGIIGAIVGAIAGFLIGNVVGLILGPFLGAVIFELIFAKQDTKKSLKAGFGTIVGFVLGILVKMVIAISMIILWQIVLR